MGPWPPYLARRAKPSFLGESFSSQANRLRAFVQTQRQRNDRTQSKHSWAITQQKLSDEARSAERELAQHLERMSSDPGPCLPFAAPPPSPQQPSLPPSHFLATALGTELAELQSILSAADSHARRSRGDIQSLRQITQASPAVATGATRALYGAPRAVPSSRLGTARRGTRRGAGSRRA